MLAHDPRISDEPEHKVDTDNPALMAAEYARIAFPGREVRWDEVRRAAEYCDEMVPFPSSVEQLIQDCIAAKDGDKEFALFSLGSGEWRAEIGNTCSHVMLGEQDGEFRGEGKTIRQAIAALLENVRTGKRAR